jgi:uracil-DNA glycosylase
MKSNPDIKKVVRQHAEMAEFFSGGLTIKKTTAEKTESPRVYPGGSDPQHEVGGLSLKTTRPPASQETINELEVIAEQTRKCCKCRLGSLRKNAVPGEGNPAALIMFVGEGPGADEDEQGRPFVGRAGQLLDKIITACGLKRQYVWIGNIIKCRPPENRDPLPDEIIACIPYLQRQIELVNPEIIVALGAHAARTLLDSPKPIGQLRGMFHEYVPGIGHKPIKLMPTFHPAYLLRNYSDDNRRKVWEDMKKVLAELNLPIPSSK